LTELIKYGQLGLYHVTMESPIMPVDTRSKNAFISYNEAVDKISKNDFFKSSCTTSTQLVLVSQSLISEMVKKVPENDSPKALHECSFQLASLKSLSGYETQTISIYTDLKSYCHDFQLSTT
jgi:hypothetical protein